MLLTDIQQQIINQYQRSFPLSARPYLEIAEQLACTEDEVIAAVSDLDEKQVLSRIGPVFDHKKAGASTLAAIAVPENMIDEIAALVNQFEQVNHNYAREHQYNLWFVVTAADDEALAQTLLQIEQMTGFAVLVLPMEASFHIDLGFAIDFSSLAQQVQQ